LDTDQTGITGFVMIKNPLTFRPEDGCSLNVRRLAAQTQVTESPGRLAGSRRWGRAAVGFHHEIKFTIPPLGVKVGAKHLPNKDHSLLEIKRQMLHPNDQNQTRR
jgi:hypothetical protein